MATRSTADPQRQAELVERLTADWVAVGMPRMASRVFAALLVRDDGRATAAELAGFLQVSPAGISGAVRYLEQLNMVHRERVPGSRRDCYRVRPDVWLHAVGGRDQVLLRMEQTLREGVDVLGESSPAGERMAETLDFFEFARKESAALVDRWRAHRAAHGH